jgi:hypothetical protein
MKLLKDIRQGAGYLEGFGDHPGTAVLVGFTLMGGVAGIANGGLYGFIGGALIAFCGLGPVWMAGCVGRARDYQRRQAAIAQNEARAEEFSLRQAQFNKDRG